MEGRQWSNDEIFDWFVGSVAREGSVSLIEPGVVRVVIEPDGSDPSTHAQQVDIVITREQLRTLAWSDEDVFDDRDPHVVPPAADPVLAGLQLLSLHVEEDLGTLRPDEHFLVFFDGRLRRSVRRELPPVRGTVTAPAARCSWTAR